MRLSDTTPHYKVLHFYAMLRHSVSFRHSKNASFSIRQKSSGGRRPKKKTYHRVPELDRVMELCKKPCIHNSPSHLPHPIPTPNPLPPRKSCQYIYLVHVRKFGWKNSLVSRIP